MNKGFTIVELLAAIAIMALIIIISVPAYEGISKTIKKSNYESKKSMMEKATLSYVNKYHKDLVFNGSNKPVCYSIKYLIEHNVFSADNKNENTMSDPENGGNLSGYLKASYEEENFEVKVEYIDDSSTFTNANCPGGRKS